MPAHALAGLSRCALSGGDSAQGDGYRGSGELAAGRQAPLAGNPPPGFLRMNRWSELMGARMAALEMVDMDALERAAWRGRLTAKMACLSRSRWPPIPRGAGRARRVQDHQRARVRDEPVDEPACAADLTAAL